MKIGLGIVTYNRPGFFAQCADSVIKNGRDIDYLVVYDDDSDDKHELEYIDALDELKSCFKEKIHIILSDKNRGVGKAKNIVLKNMFNHGCDYMFTLEDDILLKSPEVFNKYIEAGKKTGFHHLNFALHGPANKGGYKYTDNTVDYYPHCVGAFSMYTKEVIEKVGYIDENFNNAWEHCEFTQRIGDAGLTSPFWAFADVHGSQNLLEEIPGSIDNSSIRPNPNWQKNIDEGLKYWREKDPNCPL